MKKIVFQYALLSGGLTSRYKFIFFIVTEVELGAFCSWDAQCAQNYSECSGNECVCISTHYDSTGDVPEGICLESKLIL